MAASYVRRVFISSKWVCQQMLKYAQQSQKTQSSHLLNGIKGFHVKTVGTSIGISYGLFGLSFGKKKEETDPLTQLYREARLAHSRNDLQRADELYHECLKLGEELVKSKKITPEKHLTSRTLMYDGLADIALQTGQVERAEKLFVETMKGCFQEGMPQDHNAIVEISIKLASLYAMQGKKEAAEEGYKFCLQSQGPKMEEMETKWKEQDKKKGGRSSSNPSELTESEADVAALLGMTLGSYGRFLLYEKRYKEALPIFQRAELIARNTIGEKTNQYIVVLNDLATLYIVSKNFDEAEKILKDGIKITEKEKLKEGAMLLCNLGAVHLRRGEVEQALKVCERGLDCAKDVDHKLAYRMADACLKKGREVLKSKKAEAKS